MTDKQKIIESLRRKIKDIDIQQQHQASNQIVSFMQVQAAQCRTTVNGHVQSHISLQKYATVSNNQFSLQQHLASTSLVRDATGQNIVVSSSQVFINNLFPQNRQSPSNDNLVKNYIPKVSIQNSMNNQAVSSNKPLAGYGNCNANYVPDDLHKKLCSDCILQGSFNFLMVFYSLPSNKNQFMNAIDQASPPLSPTIRIKFVKVFDALPDILKSSKCPTCLINELVNTGSNLYQKVPEEKVPIGIFWDIENCRIPKNKPPKHVVAKIRKALLKSNKLIEKQFVVACNVRKESKDLMVELNNSYVRILHVQSRKKNAADIKLNRCIKQFCMTYPVATICLITGDIDFNDLIGEVQAKGYKVVLIHPIHTSMKLKYAANKSLKFQSIVS